MSYEFHVGQKVVCVDDRKTPNLHRGSIYTITFILPPAFSRITRKTCEGILLAEAEPLWGRAFCASRFRPFRERKTDISIFKAMLTPSEAREEA